VSSVGIAALCILAVHEPGSKTAYAPSQRGWRPARTARLSWWLASMLRRPPPDTEPGVRRPGAAAGSCHGRKIQMAATVMSLSPATRRMSPGSLVTMVI
jgi:hypothetical protein